MIPASNWNRSWSAKMCPIVIWILAVCLVSATLSMTASPRELKLELVQVLFRHGDRTPRQVERYPNEPTGDLRIYETLGFGQLTKSGKMRAYRLGQMLRERYNEFLGMYRNGDVMTVSTNSERTSMTGQLVLAGLFPPKTRVQPWNKDLNWDPIPIFTVHDSIDGIFNIRDCNKSKEEYDKIMGTVGVEKILTPYRDFIQLAEEKMGIKTDLKRLQDLWAMSEAKMSLNVSLPEWCTEDFMSQLKDVARLRNQLMSYNPLLRRYNGGPLIKNFLRNMKLPQNSDGERRKLYLFSAHDTDIVGVALALNISSHVLPKYSAAIVVEKLVDPTVNTTYVRIGVFNDDQPSYQTRKMRDCPSLCPVSRFEKLVRDVTPTNEETSCMIKEMTDDKRDKLVQVNSQIKL